MGIQSNLCELQNFFHITFWWYFPALGIFLIYIHKSVLSPKLKEPLWNTTVLVLALSLFFFFSLSLSLLLQAFSLPHSLLPLLKMLAKSVSNCESASSTKKSHRIWLSVNHCFISLCFSTCYFIMAESEGLLIDHYVRSCRYKYYMRKYI